MECNIHFTPKHDVQNIAIVVNITTTLFRTFGLLPFDVRIHYFTAVAMFNIMNGQAPVYLENMFKQINSVHEHNTRGGTNIRVKKYNLSIGQRTSA